MSYERDFQDLRLLYLNDKSRKKNKNLKRKLTLDHDTVHIGPSIRQKKRSYVKVWSSFSLTFWELKRYLNRDCNATSLIFFDFFLIFEKTRVKPNWWRRRRSYGSGDRMMKTNWIHERSRAKEDITLD